MTKFLAAAYALLDAKAPEAAILHAYEVAAHVESPAATLAALLHDAVEDGFATKAEVTEAIGGYEDADVAVFILTRSPGETYAHYVETLAASGCEVAIQVKIADLTVNLNRCLKDFQAAGKMPSLAQRYIKALAVLAK